MNAGAARGYPDLSIEAAFEDLAAAPARPLTDWRKLAIFFAMAVGQFMALLDIQIVVSSLSSIQGGLSASQDEIDWVQTSYLMAEIVMIPLSAYLAQALSSRWVFVASAALFTVTSLACGAAWDLPTMVICRAVQGFVGGAMIPLAFATGFQFFDGKRAATATAVLGVVSTLAPTLGPAVGGWITETLGWRWLFFVNIAPGAMVTLALVGLGRYERAQPRLLLQIDWLHALSMAAFLGGLQYVLQEGPMHQWLSDQRVAAVAWVTLVAGLVFAERCLYSPRPLLDLKPFRHRGFAAACVLSFIVGFTIYTSVYLTPLFLARVRDFSSLDIGLTVFIAGVSMTLAAAPTAALAARIDLRIMMAVGLVIYAISFWMMSSLGPEWGFWELFLPQAVRGFAVLFTVVAVVGMALREMPDDILLNASGVNNLMRNLGGAVGIALTTTWLIDFANLHGASLARAAQPGEVTSAAYGLGLRFVEAGVDPAAAPQMAAATLMNGVQAQALTLAFDDVFRIIALTSLFALLFVPFCRAGPLTQGPRGH
jgi:DHA2 family multidrug resistance protein